MCSRRKCVFRYVVYLFSVVLCANYALPQELVNKSPRLAAVCLNGAFNRVGRCVCNPGYSEYQGNCFLQSVLANVPQTGCPEGTVLWNGFCHYRSLPPMRDVVPPQEKLIVVPPLRIDIPTPELIDPLDPNEAHEETEPGDNDQEDDDDEPEVIVPPIQGHNLNLNFQKVVSNHNVVNNATVVHTHNENNVMVHLSRNNANGGIRTVVIRNNETTVYDDREHESGKAKNDKEESTTEVECTEPPVTTEMADQVLPCCTIVSPRVCRKQEDEWVCFHRKQYECSTVCTADVMYLRPRKPSYRKPWLIMPPRPNPFAHFKPCRWGRCPRLDCSGCIRGKLPCHPRCYTYDCMIDNSCHFIDQDIMCNDSSNGLCALLEEKTIVLLRPSEADS